MRDPVQKLEEAVGHRFADRELLHRALTHSSHVHERPSGLPATLADNEQLEFLGDAVLGFLISESLVSRFASFSEGRLSKLRAHLVSAVHLYKVARKLDLGDYLVLGRGEEMSGGRAKKTLLVNALEALIAALYLDGGIETARRFVAGFVLGDGIEGLGEEALATAVDYKSALQELAQARKLPAPRYAIVRELGPDHSKTFTVEVRVGREWVAQAEGASKKIASQGAARGVLQKIQESNSPPGC
ncbi:MAG: ribonuclease III [Acidobacteria bacterium]|nr:ribonuclease III [Acidobacteriota bacterium]MBI3470796.1 ribonuclease III [Candidatus Solibacter usitatus]